MAHRRSSWTFGSLSAAVLATALAALASGEVAQAAGVVGSGTPASCTEVAFDAALVGGGLVTFDCGASPATIVFTAQKGISASTDLDGGGLVTLSGGDAVRLFDVTGGATLGIANLTLVDGHLTAVNENGAAVRTNPGNLVISNSTLSGHTVDQGGCGAIGMFNGSSLAMTASTVSGNYASSQGGAMCLFNTDADIVNSTISGNSAGAGGGIDASSSGTTRTIAIESSTIANNTSDLTASGNEALQALGATTIIRLRNSIVANNPSGNCDVGLSAQIVDDGNNLQFPAELVPCAATIPVADPLLGPLADNGGPSETMALFFGSPAIDAGDQATCPVLDQRGEARVDGNFDTVVTCDIGAFELTTLPVQEIPTLGPAGLLTLFLGLGAAARLVLARRGA